MVFEWYLKLPLTASTTESYINTLNGPMVLSDTEWYSIWYSVVYHWLFLVRVVGSI